MVNGKLKNSYHSPFTIRNMSAKIKIICVIYIFILAGIVVLADLRGTRYLLDFVGNIPFGDKIGHFCLMGMFSLLVNLTLAVKTVRFWKFDLLLGSLLVALVVTAEEFSQIFISGRTFDAGDLAFDFAGIFICGEAARLIAGKIMTD